jgi:integrase
MGKTTGLRNRNGTWYFDTTVEGYRLTDKIGKVSEKEAIAALAKIRYEIWEGKYYPGRQGKSLTVLDVLNEYWEKRLKFLKSGSNRKFILSNLKKHFGHYRVDKLRTSDIEAYQRLRLSTPIERNGKQYAPPKPRTINSDIEQLQTTLEWAVDERLITHNPIRATKLLPTPAPEKKMLDTGTEYGTEWLRLYNAALAPTKTGKKREAYIANALYLQYHTGMRIGEVLSLRWEWVAVSMVIDQNGNQKTIFSVNLPAIATKAKKNRSIPITPDLYRWIQNIPRTGETVICRQNGKPFKHMYKIIREIAADAGLQIRSHDLRRTRLQIWDRIDERASMAAGGHEDQRVHRKHYTTVTPDMLQTLTGSNKNPDNIPTTIPFVNNFHSG